MMDYRQLCQECRRELADEFGVDVRDMETVQQPQCERCGDPSDEPTPRNLATLTPEENRTWEEIFAALVESGQSDEDADALAWTELCEAFPRLKDYDGCQP
jgi:hypothetical protein